MNSGWLIAAVLASVVAGGAGGFVAVEYFGAEKEAPREVTAAATEDETDYDGAADDQAQNKLISSLRGDIDSLRIDLEKAENKKADNSALLEEIDTLKARITELESSEVVVANDGSSGATPAADPGSDEFKAAIDEAIEKREEEERAERQAEREQWMKDRATRQNEAILTKLTEDLALDAVQQENVKLHLENMQTKRAEVVTRGMAAREAGEEFDWRTEMAATTTEATEAIRGELSLSQESTFNDLLGEDGTLDSIAGGGGRGGFGGGRRG